jgi:hypothetical protein
MPSQLAQAEQTIGVERQLIMRIALALSMVACSPFGPCEPSSPRTEVWLADERTGTVEATLRDGCGFPDAQIDYRIIGKRPRGRYQLLFEGSLKHWDRRHGVVHGSDSTVEIAVWDRVCVPDGDVFSCSHVDPVARWHE